MTPRSSPGFFFVLALLVPGCWPSGRVAYAPVDNVDFAVMQELEEIDGIYRDTSEKTVHRSGQGYLVESLTEILWRTGGAAAVTVEVRTLGEGRLSIRSLDREGAVVKEQVFVAGPDFEFTDGRIRFRRSNLLLQDGKDALLGPDVTTIEFGIDKRGDGKVRTRFTGAGLLIVVPAAVKQTMEYRFQRVGDRTAGGPTPARLARRSAGPRPAGCGMMARNVSPCGGSRTPGIGGAVPRRGGTSIGNERGDS